MTQKHVSSPGTSLLCSLVLDDAQESTRHAGAEDGSPSKLMGRENVKRILWLDFVIYIYYIYLFKIQYVGLYIYIYKYIIIYNYIQYIYILV